MAYSFVGGSGQYLSANATVITDYPLTLFIRTSLQVAPSDSSAKISFAITNATSTSVGHLLYNLSSSANAWSNNQSATLSGGQAQNVYHAATGLYASATSRQIYTNNTASAANTANVSFPTGNRVTIGAWFNGPTVMGYDSAHESDAAIWACELTPAEIASLVAGFSPRRIRPQSLRFYAPLTRNLHDIVGGLVMTNNNASTVAPSPRRYGQ